jgi:phosphoglycolate phosphatase-like HAD superfamily hydrolase
VQTFVPHLSDEKAFIRPGFRWDAAAAYLFDIDGTLLNSRDAVHYFAFRHATEHALGVQVSLEDVPVHGNTDPGILRAALQHEGIDDDFIDNVMDRMVEHMCAEVERNREQLRPVLCPGILDMLFYLRKREKLLGAASGNLERIGRLKLKKAGLCDFFAFGSFSFPRQTRAEIFAHGIALARERLGDRATVFVVGDTPSDIAAARAVNAPVIALATGFFSLADLNACRPDACFASAADMVALGYIR